MSPFSGFHRQNLSRLVVHGAAVFIACNVALAGAQNVSFAQKQTPPIAPQAKLALVDLTGHISDAVGSPLPGATVYVYTAAPRVGTSPFCPSCYVDCGKHQATDAQGRFRIPAVDSSLIFRLLVVKEGYVSTFVPKVDPLQSPLRATLKKSPAGSQDLQRQVAGRVLDPDGHPVVGATVEPVGLQTGKNMTFGSIPGMDPLTITNARGEFRFDCPQPGSTVTARITARGLAPQVVADLKTGTRAPKTVTMASGTTVAGTVRSATGAKMAGVTVEIVPVNRNIDTFVGWFEIGTDAEGKFSLPNIPAEQKYVICVRMDSLAEKGMAMPRQALITGKNDTAAEGVNLTVQPAAAITGHIVLTDGKPIRPGTRIMLSRAETWDQQQATLAEDGSFTFRGVPPEEALEFNIQIPGHHVAENTPGYAPGDPSVHLTFSEGSSPSDVRITLAPDAK